MRKITEYIRDRRGAVAIIVALSLPMIAGFAALGIDMGYIVLLQARLQAAADAAALAAATAIDEPAQAKILAVDYASENMTAEAHGHVLDPSDVVFGNWKAETHTFTAGGAPTNAVQVITRRSAANGNPARLFFARILGFDASDVNAEAIATAGAGGAGDFCILSLEPNESAAIQIGGTVNLLLGCGIAVTSDHPKQALKVSGTDVIDATKICVSGGAQISGTVTFLDAEPTENCPTPPDPLADLPPPPEADDPCDYETDHEEFKISGNGGTYDLSPGVYCNGITISGSDNTINFLPDPYGNPGTYVLAGGGMRVSGGNNHINGSEVMFYNTDYPELGYDYEDIDFSGDTFADLSAPTSGDYAGVLFFNDRESTALNSSIKFKVAGTVEPDFDGVIYFPHHQVEYSGTSTQTNECNTKIIARSIKFNGTTDSVGGPNCAGNGVQIGGGTAIRLVR